MPIYAYRCSACGFQKDVLQKISDPVLSNCPECNKDTFSKQLTAPGFQLKGSGWYATDFKGGSKPVESDKPTAETPAKETTAKETTTTHACGSGACSSCS